MQAVFTLLAGLGILMALFGWNRISAGAHPGLNLPQGMLIVGGLMLSLVAFRLRRADARRRAWGTLRKRWLPGLVAAAVTLIALEFVLAAVDRPPLYFPPDPLQDLLEPLWRWTCDEVGCRYDYDTAVIACVKQGLTARGGTLPSFPHRRCILNRQGFHDTQDFEAGADFDERMRILMLGDSYTMGASADIGKSYVETIEANFPQSVVWNTGIPGAGTHQALAVFRAYAPVLQPQLTILGFYGNDFNDNLWPMDVRLWLGKSNDGRVLLRRHDDDSGNAKISLDEKKDYYYRVHGLEPPVNEIERVIGRTRLGSLLLSMIDREPLEHSRVDTTRGYLRDLREAAAAQDTALLILLIPSPNDIPSPGGRYRSALQLFEELGLANLNPIHLLDGELDYPPGNFHWNSAGHQKIGAVLSDCIETFQVSGDLADCEEVEMP